MGFSIVGAPLLKTEIAFSLVHPSSGYPKPMLEIFHDVVHSREKFVASRIIYPYLTIEAANILDLGTSIVIIDWRLVSISLEMLQGTTHSLDLSRRAVKDQTTSTLADSS